MKYIVDIFKDLKTFRICGHSGEVIFNDLVLKHASSPVNNVVAANENLQEPLSLLKSNC